MARTAAFWAAPSALLAWSWLRLSQPHAAASTALWLIALALAPALLPRPRQRRLALAAFAASTSSAVASGQVLHWQGWDFYTKPAKPVGVGYVWNSNFTGLHFPKKVTPLLTIRAPSRPTYWRATTLDVFDGRNWREKKGAAVPPIRIGGRDELLAD